MASPSMSGVSMNKKEGSNVEFHEYLGLLFLEFLFKVGLHDNTFDPVDFGARLVQFRPLLVYE